MIVALMPAAVCGRLASAVAGRTAVSIQAAAPTEGLNYGRISRRAAQTLNSGIRDVGSSAGLVRRLAQASSPQWNGTNRVSGRIVGVSAAFNVANPRRVVTRTRSPPAIPRRL